MAEMKQYDLGNGVTVQASEDYAKRMFPDAKLVEVKKAPAPRNKARGSRTK